MAESSRGESPNGGPKGSDSRSAPKSGESFGGELYRQWEKGMSAWWDQVLDSREFLDAMGKNVAMNAKARQTYEGSVDEAMERAHLPSRTDVVRIARICTLLEDRLLGMEDELHAVRDRLDAMSKEALAARVDAAEARLELRAALKRLEEGASGQVPGTHVSSDKPSPQHSFPSEPGGRGDGSGVIVGQPSPQPSPGGRGGRNGK